MYGAERPLAAVASSATRLTAPAWRKMMPWVMGELMLRPTVR